VAAQRLPGHDPRPAPPQVPTAEQPSHPRTTASVDSQSVDTTSGGEQPGRGNAKSLDGSNRHIMFLLMELCLAVTATAVDVDVAKAAAELFAGLEGQPAEGSAPFLAWKYG